MLFWGDLFYLVLGLCLPIAIKATVMGPAHRFRKTARGATGPRDPLAPPPFNGDGNPVVWARRVAKWERAHEALCAQGDKRGYPDYFRGYLLSEALYGTAFRTVESTLSEDDINSKDGVKRIVELLVKFNPTTAAHEIFSAYKRLLEIRRGQKESFKLYVNRFEAAASELRNLTGQTEHGEAEQLLAFQLLEGAQIPTPVFLQLLTNCLSSSEDPKDGPSASPEEKAMEEFTSVIQAIPVAKSEELETALEGIADDKKAKVKTTFRATMTRIAVSLTAVKGKLMALSAFKEAKKQDPYAMKTVSIDFESVKKALRGLDAVSLDELGAAPRNLHSPTSNGRANIQAIVRETLLSHSHASSPSVKPKGRYSNKTKKGTDWAERLAKKKASSKCHDCNQIGHWAGDQQCPAPKSRHSGHSPTSAPRKAEDTEEQATFFQ